MDDFFHTLSALEEHHEGIVRLVRVAGCSHGVVVHLVAAHNGAGVGGVVEQVVVSGEVLHLVAGASCCLHHDGGEGVFLQRVGLCGVVVGYAAGRRSIDGRVLARAVLSALVLVEPPAVAVRAGHPGIVLHPDAGIGGVALHEGVQCRDDAVGRIHRAVGVAEQARFVVGLLEPVVVGAVEAHVLIFEGEVVRFEVIAAVGRSEVGDALVEVATPVAVVRRDGTYGLLVGVVATAVAIGDALRAVAPVVGR